jgi:hypothetical protein
VADIKEAFDVMFLGGPDRFGSAGPIAASDAVVAGASNPTGYVIARVIPQPILSNLRTRRR